MFMYTYALYTVFHACFPIQIHWHTCIYLISDLLSFPYVTYHCLYMYAWATSLDHVHVWLLEHANWLYYMYSRVASDNPRFLCPDPGVWTVALLYLIRVAQLKRGLAVTYPDPPSSSLSLIGSRDSHLATHEYFPVFYIVHPTLCFLMIIYSWDIISCLMITVYLCYYWNIYCHCASVLWFLHVLMLSVYTWGYFWPAYIRCSNISVTAGSGRYITGLELICQEVGDKSCYNKEQMPSNSMSGVRY